MAYRRHRRAPRPQDDPCYCAEHCPECHQKCMGGHSEGTKHWCPTGCEMWGPDET